MSGLQSHQAASLEALQNRTYPSFFLLLQVISCTETMGLTNLTITHTQRNECHSGGQHVFGLGGEPGWRTC